MMPLSRRGVLAGAGLGLAMPAMAAQPPDPAMAARPTLTAGRFGAVGDGKADDSRALQSALDAAFAHGGAFLQIEPGTYRVTRPLKVLLDRATVGDLTHPCGILARGARLVSEVQGGPVLTVESRTTARFLLIEGLDIQGSGREKGGLSLLSERAEHYLYNICLRDVVIQGCGGDGCSMRGNVFESQIINSYFRNNQGNGLTCAHSDHGGVLSSVHVFGSVLGQNGEHGAALVHHCYDISFHGCYFLENGRFGLFAENGCTLLSNCGFENNHSLAKSFAEGDQGVFLNNFGTLIGCGAYSMHQQTGLIRAFVVRELVMVGCMGAGDGPAKAAGLAKLTGLASAMTTIVGCHGAIECAAGFEALEIGGPEGGVRFGAQWDSRMLPRLGDYRLWVDRHGRLRLKRGQPGSDEDGSVVGA